MNFSLGQTWESLARRVWPPLFLAAFVAVTWALIDSFGGVVYTQIAVKMFIMLIVVLGLQVFSGNSGVLSFGHVAFMAVGAYVSALLTIPTAIKTFTYLSMPHFLKSWIFPAQLNALEGTLAGAGFAMVLALLVAAPIVRLTGVAAGIATLAILVIVHEFDYQTSAVTRGTSTQIGVPTTTTLLSVVAWALIFIGVAFAFQQSRFGLRLRASRENERAARSVGVRVPIERAIAWTISGFIVGVAGAQYAHAFGGTFGPDDFFFNNGLNIVLLTIAMLVVGGMTSVTGAVVGCYFVTIIFEAVRRWEINGLAGVSPPAGTSNFVLAIVLLVTLVARPGGITRGKEVPWPTDWRLPRRPTWRRPAPLARFRGTVAANEPAASAETAPTD
jgi:branched-chain amino acid transport system permease protein